MAAAWGPSASSSYNSYVLRRPLRIFTASIRTEIASTTNSCGKSSPPSPLPNSPDDSGPQSIANTPVSTSWLPPSPPPCETLALTVAVPTPSPLPLLEHIRSFLSIHHDTNLNQFHTIRREFRDVSLENYRQTIAALTALRTTLFEYPKRSRIDYFGNSSTLFITVPGLPHETMTSYTHDLHSMLFEQGFAWPAWGSDVDHVLKSGTTGFELVHRGRVERLQPDGGLQLAGSRMPFLVVEVADSEGYDHAFEKGRRYLLHSQGLIRFVIIIKLVRGRVATAKGDDDSGEDECSSQLESSPPRRVGSKKRVAGSHSNSTLQKKARTTAEDDLPSDSEIVQHSSSDPQRTHDSTPSEDPPCSQDLPPNPRDIYSHGLVTVLSSKSITIAGKKKRILVHLVDSAEFWPTPPATTAVFSFSWADMPVVSYPPELAGKVFTVTFGRLHALLQRFFEAGTTAWGALGEVPVDCADEEEYLSSSEKEAGKAVDGDRWWAIEAPVTSGEAEEEDGEWQKG